MAKTLQRLDIWRRGSVCHLCGALEGITAHFKKKSEEDPSHVGRYRRHDRVKDLFSSVFNWQSDFESGALVCRHQASAQSCRRKQKDPKKTKRILHNLSPNWLWVMLIPAIWWAVVFYSWIFLLFIPHLLLFCTFFKKNLACRDEHQPLHNWK